MKLSPKARFLEKYRDLADRHRDGTASDSMLRAAEATLAQMVCDLPDSTDAATAIAGYNRIVGARQFLNAFLCLCDPVQERPKPVNRNLPSLNQ